MTKTMKTSKEIKEYLKHIWFVKNPTDEDVEFVKKNSRSYVKQERRFAPNGLKAAYLNQK